MSIFTKKPEETVQVSTSSDKIYFVQVTQEDDKVLALADRIKDSVPVVVNFEKLDVASANKTLAFLSGVVYALGGKAKRIDNKTYLFARAEEFLDGSLNEFLKNFVD